jgi:Ca2+-binding EF-hand superfamily protein
MKNSALVLLASVFLFATAGMSANAQQPSWQEQVPTDMRPKQDDKMRGGMLLGMMGHGMMGRRGMMGRQLALRIIFALVDNDGDGKISLQEFQAAHEKLFKAMDADKDGTLTIEEIQAFMHGMHRANKACTEDEGQEDDED